MSRNVDGTPPWTFLTVPPFSTTNSVFGACQRGQRGVAHHVAAGDRAARLGARGRVLEGGRHVAEGRAVVEAQRALEAAPAVVGARAGPRRREVDLLDRVLP